MTEPRDLRDDDTLLAEIGRMLSDDRAAALHDEAPVPAAAVAVARAAFQLRGVDEELATLVLDSLHDEALLVRHEDRANRLLSYVSSGLSLDVELVADGRTLMGVVSPAGPTAIEIEIETADATDRTTTDDLGRFRVDSAPGWIRLRVRAEGSTLVTPVIVR